ncbi:MAG: PTS IIA-like nitrogen regulatory protein PtsN [Rhizobiaceae bacterium]
MELNDIISPDSILANLKPNSKKQLLQELAEAGAAQLGVDVQAVFETLLEREHLGSTGVGNGVAIPHGKIAGIDRIVGVFAQLAKPVEFDSMDEQPVDIAFMLLAPEGSGADHLKALSRIARVLRNQATLASIRHASDPDAIYSLLTAQESASAA